MILPINEIITGECSEVLATFPADSIDLTVTSPPYDNLREYNGYTFDFEAIAQQLWRVTKPGGVVVWIVADQTVNGSETGTSFRQALHFMGIGFNLHDTMIYKPSGVGAKGSHYTYWQAFEFMFVLSKGKSKTVNRIRDKYNRNAGHLNSPTVRAVSRHRDHYITQEIGIRDNIWEYDTVSIRWGDGGDHFAQFPEALARDHIISWSSPSDIVLDPMCGSGTTCKMAIETGRRYIGIDISAEYCDLARRRVAGAKVPLIPPGSEAETNGKPQPEQSTILSGTE